MIWPITILRAVFVVEPLDRLRLSSVAYVEYAPRREVSRKACLELSSLGQINRLLSLKDAAKTPGVFLIMGKVREELEKLELSLEDNGQESLYVSFKGPVAGAYPC